MKEYVLSLKKQQHNISFPTFKLLAQVQKNIL